MRATFWSGIVLMSGSLAFGQSISPECSCRTGRPGAIVSGPRFSGPIFSSPVSSEFGPRTDDAEYRFAAQSVDRSPLQVIIPERVLNRLLTEQTSDTGPVRDVIAQADVVGEQSTVGQIHVDCRPSANRGEIHLVMQGIVSSDTVGWTSQAAVSTVGRHQVYAIKPVMFDGLQVTTRRPQIWVDVQNQNVSARTPYDGIPILNWIAQSTVRSETRRRQPQIDAETAESVAARLGPKFNRDADKRLAKLNQTWRDDWMAKYNELWPRTFSIRTTDSELQLSASWPDAPLLTAAEMSSVQDIVDQDEITIRVHESVLNSALNRLPIAGNAYSEKQLREAIEGFIAQINGKVEPKKENDDADVVIEPPPGVIPMIRLAKETPVRMKIDKGSVRLLVKAGIEIAGQTILAEDEITMPLLLADKQTAWRIEPGTLSFAKADSGTALVGMVDTIVRNQLAASIPATSYPKSLPITDPDLPLDSMQMTKMEATPGWLTISFAAEPRGQRILHEYEVPRQSLPDEVLPSIEIVPPRLQPLPDETLPNDSTARRSTSSRVTVRAARVPTHNPVPITDNWAAFEPRRSSSRATRTPTGFLK